MLCEKNNEIGSVLLKLFMIKLVTFFQTRSRSQGCLISGAYQWSFRRTGTMGTLVSQAEIGVWGSFCRGPVCHLRKSFRLYIHAKSCNLVHF